MLSNQTTKPNLWRLQKWFLLKVKRKLKHHSKLRKQGYWFPFNKRVRVLKVSLNPSVLSRFLLIVKKKNRGGSVFNWYWSLLSPYSLLGVHCQSTFFFEELDFEIRKKKNGNKSNTQEPISNTENIRREEEKAGSAFDLCCSFYLPIFCLVCHKPFMNLAL